MSNDRRERWLSVARAASLLVLLGVAGCASSPPAGAPAAERSITILTMNDVYRIEGLDDGKVGGLARLRTLRAELEASAPGRVLLLHGGDVIFPSLLSREYQGKQMIDVMNLLDGDATPGRIDERMLVVFGNHEFDSESCATPPHLQARVAESDFLWLSSNVAPSRCPDGRPRVTGVNVLHARILDVGGIRVGLFGLTIPIPLKDVAFLDPLATATALTADLRRRGAEVVIAVTHLPKEEDERIYAALRERGLDLIVGGHEHEHMALPPGGTPRIFKADADAATAWVITLRLGSDGGVRVEPSLRKMDDAIRPDPAVAGRVAQWLERHAAEFCAKQGKPASCLAEPLATTRTPLIAEEEKVRGAETSLGNWVTDLMRAAFTACGADAAIINAGSLRLNHDLPRGTTITRRHVEELMQFPTPLYLVELGGAQLQRAMENAISQPGAGRWLQVSGLAFVHERSATPPRVSKLFVSPSGGRPAVDLMQHPEQRVRVVVNEYITRELAEGFVGILPPVAQALPCAASGTDLKALILTTLTAQGSIAPTAEGRICAAADTATRECQADMWARPSAR